MELTDRHKTRHQQKQLYVRHSRKTVASPADAKAQLMRRTISECKAVLPTQALPPATITNETLRAKWYMRAVMLQKSGFPYALANVNTTGPTTAPKPNQRLRELWTLIGFEKQASV
jgi:hypothetical protein